MKYNRFKIQKILNYYRKNQKEWSDYDKNIDNKEVYDAEM